MISQKPWIATVVVDEEKQIKRPSGKKVFVKGGRWQINASDGTIVAHDGGMPQLIRRALREEEVSNAYLMAAAPALLDALRDVMDAFFDDRWEGTEIYEKAKAVIESATGEKYVSSN